MKNALLAATVFYCLGIILAGIIRINFWLASALAGSAFALSLMWAKKEFLSWTAVLFLALCVGYLSFQNSCRLSKCHIRNFVYRCGCQVYSVAGFVAGSPELKNGICYFILRTQEIQLDKLRYRCCGDLLVMMNFSLPLDYGDHLTLAGKLTRPAGSAHSPTNYKKYLARQGIYLVMAVRDRRQIIRTGLDTAKGSLWSGCSVRLIRSCLHLRVYLEKIISRHLPDLPASILMAMVLGQKRNLPWLVNNSMVKSGTVHILVVSGFNVGIVAFIAGLLLKVAGFRRKARIILVSAVLLVYCLVTGATNPVTRATVMGLIFLAAYFLRREPDIYACLSCAALFILAFNPQQLFDIGFQLSFSSVLAIVYLYPRLKARMRLEDVENKILKFIGEGFLVSFSAWLGTWIIIALNFRMVTPVAVLANILIVPLATLITLCGFTLVLTGLICPGLSGLLSPPVALLINLLLNINVFLTKLPLAYIYF